MTDETRSRRQILKATAVVTGGVALAGCSGDGGETGGGGTEASGGGGGGSGEFEQTSTVDMNDELAFAPKKIEVEAGTEVTWENVGNIGHSVTAYEDEIPDDAEYWASGGFDSQDAAAEAYSDGEGNVPGGESWSYTFETTGTHEYYCIPHEMNGMVGTVRVV